MPPQNQSKVPVGTVLEGKFRITKEIGRGGMAAVYEAENIDIGKRVAVKVLAAELINSRVVRERFIREARAAAAIRSPYICDVYDSGMFEERPFLVMELLEGESLYDMMTRVRQIDVETTVRIITHTARGLQKAHEANVVHRDLKPENIFLTKDEDGKLTVKIVDFGLAKFYEPTTADAETVRLTREGALFGTPAYMSPEQARGKGEADHRADLWALGCIVYECLTGQTVWNVEQGVAMILAQIASAPLPKPTKLRPDLPPAFDTWFAHALDRDAAKRFQSAKELSETLSQALLAGHAPRASTLSSADESMDVDALMSTQTPLAGGSAGSGASAGLPELPGQPTVRAPAPAQGGVSVPPEPGTGRAISTLLLLSSLSLGAYAVWMYVLHPPGAAPTTVHPLQPKAPPSASAAVDKGAPRPVESDAYALKIATAQELLAQKQPKQALDALKDSMRMGGAPVARSVLSHASLAIEEPSGPCSLTGISRPRPYSIEIPVSRPSMVHTAAGNVFVWIDNHQDAKKRQAYAVLLDDSLRRTSPEIPVTPEATSARTVQLTMVGEQIVLTYWDDGGSEPGVYARLLSKDGHIQSPARAISGVRKGDLYPALAPSAGGSFWMVWQEEVDKGSSDLMARQLNAELSPLADPIRLSAVPAAKGANSAVNTPSAAVASGFLNITFSVNRGYEHFQVYLLRLALTDPQLKTGLATSKKPGRERYAGQLEGLSTRDGKNTAPNIACGNDGCFVAWDDEKAGASVGFIDKDKGQSIWRRDFGQKAARPAVFANGASAVVSWYDESRLRFAPLTRDGLGPTSLLSRVSGFQPQPDIAPGEAPGKWYISWRDYESAHLEVFALRAECP